MTTPSARATAASRDAHLTLRRVERQQQLIAILCRCGTRRTLRELADDLGVTPRTVGRDVRRLRDSGVPVDVAPGRAGGVRLAARPRPEPIGLETDEIAALLASLAAVGPTVSEPARSATSKLVAALAEARRRCVPEVHSVDCVPQE